MPASAEYMREYRARHPDRAGAANERNAARQAAARIVAGRHRQEWSAAYLAECERRGVDPFPPTGRRRLADDIGPNS